jgi:DNA polymerase III alpha subunit
MANPFVHLHNHTDYSLLDGACEISQMMQIIEEQKMPAVATTAICLARWSFTTRRKSTVCTR